MRLCRCRYHCILATKFIPTLYYHLQVDASRLKLYYVLDPNIHLASSIDPAITDRTLSLIDTLSTECGMKVESYQNKLFQWSLPIWTGTNLTQGDPSIDKQLTINDPNYIPVSTIGNLVCLLFPIFIQYKLLCLLALPAAVNTSYSFWVLHIPIIK